MVPLSFAGEAFGATPAGALFWPRRKALIVADLHLEKASWYARLGQLLPPYDSVATLSALHALIVETGARELWCLGDSFHDTAGADRLSRAARTLIGAIAERTAIHWIAGNHDPAISPALPGEAHDSVVRDGLVLRHISDARDPRPELSGHYHPKLSVTARGRRVARPCFVRGPSRLILPAFGSLTGGMDASDPVIIRAVGTPSEALIASRERLLAFAHTRANVA